MKNFIAILLAGACLLYIIACGHAASSTTPPQNDSVSAPKDSAKNVFFPVANYLESEILHIDSTPLALMKYTIKGTRRDSGYIQIPEFNLLAKQFLVPELINGSFEKDFAESSFMDKTTESITFTYSPRNEDLALKRLDVLADPGTTSNKVKSIYLERSFTTGDTLVHQRLYWKAGRNFQIVNTYLVHDKPPVEQQVKVVWNTGEEAE